MNRSLLVYRSEVFFYQLFLHNLITCLYLNYKFNAEQLKQSASLIGRY